jgi:hypothetical protein
MGPEHHILRRTRDFVGLDKYGIYILIFLMLSVIILVVYYTQRLSEEGAQPPIITTSTKEQYEIAKLAAEIRQIRSDTSGSLFWLKMIALFVTVGGAVGGYLVGQKQTTRKRLEFENLKNIDAVYQGMVLELAAESPLLRAAAAVKLGTILQSFPSAWAIDDSRREQMVQLTKQVLAASLAIEDDPKVLKTLSIALVLHKPWEADLRDPLDRISNVFVATIPFAFRAGEKAMPSGDYTGAITTGGDALAIRDQDSRMVSIRLQSSVTASTDPEITKLVFYRYSKTYFLSEVWTSQLSKPGGERELKRHLAVEPSKQGFSGTGDEVIEILNVNGFSDVRSLDLSGAKAADAYWARVDFSYSDFFKAKLAGASLRRSVLRGAAFREAEMLDAVLAQADCNGADFKMADLRRADLRDADLTKAKLLATNLEEAKVFGCVITGAKFRDNPDVWVDNSKDGDGSQKIKLADWIALG